MRFLLLFDQRDQSPSEMLLIWPPGGESKVAPLNLHFLSCSFFVFFTVLNIIVSAARCLARIFSPLISRATSPLGVSAQAQNRSYPHLTLILCDFFFSFPSWLPLRTVDYGASIPSARV